MNTLDLILGIIFISSFVMGFKKGFFSSLMSLAGTILGVYLGVLFMNRVEPLFRRWFDFGDLLLQIFSFLAIFLLVVLVFSILGKLLTQAARMMMMGMMNRIGGGIFSILKYAMILSVIFFFVDRSASYSILSEDIRDSSKLYNIVAPLAPSVYPGLEDAVENLKTELNLDPMQERMGEGREEEVD